MRTLDTVAAGLLAATALGGAALADTPSGTFTVAINQEPQDLAAQGTYKEINAPGLRNVLETLIHLDPLTNEYQGVLAKSWERIDDRSIRFQLREGVTFHDGTAFDAEAAARAVTFVWDPENAFTIQEFAGPGIITAEAEGPHTLLVTSSEPDPLLEFRLSLNGIFSPRQIDEDQAGHFDNPIGTGPYRFVEWVRGQYWSAEYNPDWWGLEANDAYGVSEPLFEELRFVIRVEDSARAAMARTGEVDMAVYPTAEQCAAAEDQDGIYCVREASNAYLYGRLDYHLHADPRLQDMRIRRAIFHAIDYEGLADLIGLARVPQGQIGWPGKVGFNDELEQYAYDPEYAMQQVEAARADGVDVDTLEVEIMGRTTTPRIGPITETVAALVSAVGIPTTVSVQPPAVANPRFRIRAYMQEAPRAMMQVHVKENPSNDYGITLLSNYGCPDIDDPAGVTRSSVYCDEEFDEKLNHALGLFGEERHKALMELVRHVHDDYAIVPLALIDRAYLVQDDYDFHVGTDHRFQVVFIEPAS